MSNQSKYVTADEAVARINPGMVVATSSLSSEPVALLEALASQAHRLEPIELLSGMFLKGYEALGEHLGNSIHLVTWFMPGSLLGNIEIGPNCNFLPLTWAQVCRYVRDRKIDVGFIQVSPANDEGYHSLGISVSLNKNIITSADLVIAQVNSFMPFTEGDTLVHESDIDLFVQDDRGLPAFPHRKADERDTEIATIAAELVPSGSTIQVGIGTIPSEILHVLASSDRSDLRVHSQVTDAARELMESGRCSSDLPNALVGDILGSEDLYRWVDHNKSIRLEDASLTHGLNGLAKVKNFVSINSALEIDLYGQLNSETLNDRQAGGIGGSIDFMMGAEFEGNRSIVAFPSTTGRGKSRIVESLAEGPVTVPRSLVQYVVTEFGVADLRNKTSLERAVALASIAHPDFRDSLLRASANFA